MSLNDSTTLVCLFHHDEQARAALEDLNEAGIPRASITVIGRGDANAPNAPTFSTLQSLGIPSRDLEHLQQGLRDGGSILAVSAVSAQEAVVERIFETHEAAKIDETVTRDDQFAAAPSIGAPLAGAALAGEAAIPIVEEELKVGKRTVDQGGVRVYRRIVEMPAEESINLREERVVVERNLVDRPATQADFNSQTGKTIELTETAEEAVVSKKARVVEEVVVSKEAAEHTERIQDTVRRTEVEVEQLPSSDVAGKSRSSF